MAFPQIVDADTKNGVQASMPAVFDGEFAPSATSKPGYGENGGSGIVGMASTADHVLRVTTTNAQTVTITVWGYEV